MGKGSARRPAQVTQQAFYDAWERTFGPRETYDEAWARAVREIEADGEAYRETLRLANPALYEELYWDWPNAE